MKVDALESSAWAADRKKIDISLSLQLRAESNVW